jgi:nicotinamide mononucleotide transporter
VYVIIQLPMQFVGFYMWRRNSTNKVQVTPRSIPWWLILLILLIIILATTGFYYLEQTETFQKFWNGGNTNNNPIMVVCDSLTFVLGTTAMFMMIFAAREQWALWIILDIAIIITFSIHTNPQIIAMSATALLNAIYGVWNWWRKVEIKEYE